MQGYIFTIRKSINFEILWVNLMTNGRKSGEKVWGGGIFFLGILLKLGMDITS